MTSTSNGTTNTPPWALERAFLCRQKMVVIDGAIERDGEWVSLHGAQTLDQLTVEWPGAELTDWESAHATVEASFIKLPKETTQDWFTDMLEVLPPVRHTVQGNEESFLMSERTYADITTILVRIGNRHWRLADRTRTTHNEAVAKVRAVMAAT